MILLFWGNIRLAIKPTTLTPLISQDPVTLHKYLYANTDPVNNIDPSGNITIGSVMTAVNIAGRLAARSVANVGRSVVQSFNKSVLNIRKTIKNGLKPKKKLDKKARKKDEEAEDLDQFLTMLEAVTGAGKLEMSNEKLVDTPRLIAAWGDGIWVKMSHTRKLKGGKKIVRVHYFKNLTTGQRVEYKFNRRR